MQPYAITGSIRVLLSAPAIASTAHVAQEHSQLEPVHSRVAFRVGQPGLSQSIESFSAAYGALDFDPSDSRGAKLDVRIALERREANAWHSQPTEASGAAAPPAPSRDLQR